ncbi:MAG TPA: type II secretion system protein GspG [Opitutales bacterium]|jgi:general secretion pathway protein G|nr:type II secretion system protein GspG [Opitutales bacterium]
MIKSKSYTRAVPTQTAKPRRFRYVDLIAIVAVAAIGYVAVNHFSAGNSLARQTATVKTFITTDLDAALHTYKNDTGSFPTSRQGLKALVEQPDNVNNWKGPYVSADELKDVWGMPYQYAYPGRHGGNTKFDAWSMGPDKQNSTSDDITNW